MPKDAARLSAQRSAGLLEVASSVAVAGAAPARACWIAGLLTRRACHAFLHA